jgi:putative oxidoreductase
MSQPSASKIGRILLLFGRLILGGIFLFAAYSKLWPPSAIKVNLAFFAMQVDSYQLLPPWGVMLVAHMLPWLELALGVFLLIGWPLRLVSTLTSLLLLGFFAVILRSYSAGLEINCGCFGPNEKLDITTIVRDGSMLALSLAVTAGAFLRRRPAAEHAPMAVAAPQPQKTE